MDYYHPFHFGFPLFGFLLTLFVGIFIGRGIAFRRMHRMAGSAWGQGCCGPARCQAPAETKVAADKDGTAADKSESKLP